MGSVANLFRRVRRGSGEGPAGAVPNDSQPADVEFTVPNMVCEGCAEKLDAALQSIDGVQHASADVRRKRVRVRYEPARVRPEQLKNAVAAAGFTAVDVVSR